MRDTLTSALDVLSALRNALPDLTIPSVILMLEAMRNPGITLPELVVRSGYAQNTVSRNVRRLETAGVVYTTRPADHRHRLAVHLTARGALLESRIRQALEP